eukprot:1146130-Pelagomonas_calceolata.AAC.1
MNGQVSVRLKKFMLPEATGYSKGALASSAHPRRIRACAWLAIDVIFKVDGRREEVQQGLMPLGTPVPHQYRCQ